MKKHIIFMAMVLYGILGYGQLHLPTPTLIIPSGLMYADHVMKTSTWDQCSPSIAIDKNNPSNLLVTFETAYYGTPSPYNWQGYYYSSDGGSTCNGYDALTGGAQSAGTPSCAYDSHSQGYLAGLNGDGTGFFIKSTTDDGLSWTGPSSNNHVNYDGSVIFENGTADDLVSSPNQDNYYSVWINQISNQYFFAKAARSLDGGATFVDGVKVTDNDAQGPNIKTGPEGEVYICWLDWGYQTGVYSTATPNMGFAYSSDGGVTYTSSLPFSFNTLGLEKIGGTHINGNPSMVVDKSCGLHRGRIYIVYGESQSPTIIGMRYSDNHGATWSDEVTISDPSLASCWFPSVCVDDVTGIVSVVYYGYTTDITTTNTYVAYSDPTDPLSATWGNIKVSSASRTPAALPSPPWGSAFGVADYEGQCLGIAAYGDHAYPVWCDSRSGLRQIWIADVQYDAPQLYSSATNQNICGGSTTMPMLLTGVRTYEAQDQITVSTCTSGGEVTIANNANVTMIAGENITIGQVFSTQPGTVFTAEIQPNMSSCQTPGVQSFKKITLNNTISDNATMKEMGLKLSAYPNPTSDFINVCIMNNNYQNVSFTITDISGRFMGQFNNPTLTSNSINQIIDVSIYASGLYIVTMAADNQRYSIKFIKE
jgi:hypothetical protein